MATETTNEDRPLVVREMPDGSIEVMDPALTVPTDDDDASTAGAAGTVDEGGTPTGEADGDHPEDAEALASATSDADREAIRARRRQERKDRKEAQKQREGYLREQLEARDRLIADMNQRLMAQENRSTQTDLAQLEAAQRRAAGAVEYYKNIVAEATKKQDGAAVADATEKMVLAREETQRLAQLRQQASAAQRGAAAPAMNPQVLAHAEGWMKRNPWYKPQGGDADSEIVLVLDRQLEREGFVAATPAYWEELDRRVERHLPHRAGKAYTPRNSHGESGSTSRSPVAGGGRSAQSAGGSGSSRSSNSYTLSAERVKALKDAGTWDDPKARSEAIRRYREYDRRKAEEARS